MDVTYEDVRKVFDYDGEKLIWKKRTSHRVKNGSVAGDIGERGYRRIGINGKRYLAHRLIWLYCYGYFPENDIDHINRNILDNRIENLREVSMVCNIRNCGNFRHNVSGVKGVYFSKENKNWVAQVKVQQKTYYIGSSKDFGEAVLLRLAVEQCLKWGSCDKMSPAHKYDLKNKLIHRKRQW